MRSMSRGRARIAEADEQEEQPLLVEARTRELPEIALVEGQGGDHHRGVGLLLAHGEAVPYLGQAGLELLELGDLLLEGEITRKRRLRDHSSTPQSEGFRRAPR